MIVLNAEVIEMNTALVMFFGFFWGFFMAVLGYGWFGSEQPFLWVVVVNVLPILFFCLAVNKIL